MILGCMYVYGMGNKMGTGAPRALRLRLAMHLFVKYKQKSFLLSEWRFHISVFIAPSGYALP